MELPSSSFDGRFQPPGLKPFVSISIVGNAAADADASLISDAHAGIAPICSRRSEINGYSTTSGRRPQSASHRRGAAGDP